MLSLIETWGIPTIDTSALRNAPPCCIIVDDAQRGYEYTELWECLVKDISRNPHIKVIIAATHDYPRISCIV